MTMNIAFFLIPKAQVACLYETYTMRQALEKMRYYGYTAIPVLREDGQYVGTVSEGDFLWYIVEDRSKDMTNDMKTMEHTLLMEVLGKDKNPPVNITTSVEELLNQVMRQNFVPVVDDKGIFIGIVTRKDIIKYFADNKNKISSN